MLIFICQLHLNKAEIKTRRNAYNFHQVGARFVL